MYLHGDIPVYEKNPFRESTFTYILNRSTYRSACFRMSEEQSGRCAGRDLSLYADTVIKPWGDTENGTFYQPVFYYLRFSWNFCHFGVSMKDKA